MTNDFYILLATPQEALDYYEYKLGVIAFLDANELGSENLQSPKIPVVDIFELERRAINPNPNPGNQIPALPSPNILNQLPPVVSQETYGFNLDNIVID
jgi:hypothetical protein